MGFEPMLALTAKHRPGPLTTEPRDSVCVCVCVCVRWYNVLITLVYTRQYYGFIHTGPILEYAVSFKCSIPLYDSAMRFLKLPFGATPFSIC